MSEENNQVKTENPYTGTSKLTDYDVTSMLSNVKDGDMQVLARLIVEMKNENEAANKRVKMQSIFSLCTSVLCLIILIIMLVTVKNFIPQLEGAVANANSVPVNMPCSAPIGSFSVPLATKMATPKIQQLVVINGRNTPNA